MYGQESTPDRLPIVGDAPDEVPPLATDLSPALDSRSIRKAIRKVADWQLRRLDSQFNTDWTMAALYAGLMAAADATGDGNYRKVMKKMGNKLDWQLGPRFNDADDLAIGQTYLELFLRDRKPAMVAHVRDRFDTIVTTPESPEKLTWWWCDALFMAPPVWARLYKATGKIVYLDYMNREWWRTSKLLYDPQEHLYSRDATFLETKEANGRKLFWSRGNGWVMAGLVRVLQYMPADYPDRAKYIAQFKEMASKVASIQGSDGLWRPGLLDAAAYPLPEVSGSAFYTYALAWGVNHDILEDAVYRSVVSHAWKGLLQHIYSDGRLGSIQPVGAAPDKYKASASYTYGVGAFLLAGLEVHDLSIKYALASKQKSTTLVLTNTIDPRREEVVDLPLEDVLSHCRASKPESTAVRDPPVLPSRVFGRFVPERLYDPTWEDDKIDFRTYGPALQAIGEISSGIDVWVKRVPDLVINSWYKRDAEGTNTGNPSMSYHVDGGQGLDAYKVGRTLRCGGTALWKDNKLFSSENYTTWKILASGPIRFSFELSYAPWQVGSITVAERKRITLDAGSHLNYIRSSLHLEDNVHADLAAGIVTNPGADLEMLPSDRGFAVWDPADNPTAGKIATAMVLPPSFGPVTAAGSIEAHKQAVLLAFSELKIPRVTTVKADGSDP